MVVRQIDLIPLRIKGACTCCDARFECKIDDSPFMKRPGGGCRLKDKSLWKPVGRSLWLAPCPVMETCLFHCDCLSGFISRLIASRHITSLSQVDRLACLDIWPFFPNFFLWLDLLPNAAGSILPLFASQKKPPPLPRQYSTSRR